MSIKKLLAAALILIAAALPVFTQALNEQQTQTPETTIKVMALNGPTGMGLSKLISENEAGQTGSNHYDFNLVGAADEITARLVKGEVDIAAVPANLASVLYNKTQGKLEVLAVNTLGVIYIVEKGDSIHSVADLRGKTIYASGKGATPEYALNYILQANGIDPVKDVDIQFKSEHAECVSALATSESGIAMLPEPFVTTSQTRNPDIHVVLDLTEEWDKLQAGAPEASSMITGVIVGTRDFIENNPEALSLFLDQYKASVDYVNANPSEAAKLIGNYGIVAEAVAEKAIPNCNIVFIEGSEMKNRLSGYLNQLYKQNPAAVGGKLPDDDFYFSR